MYTLRVEIDFAAAHFLSTYHGKCEKLHGHNYKARLWVKGQELDNGGMLMDFSVLKKTLKQAVKELDHSCLNDMVVFDNNPSAERIARFIYENTCKLFKEMGVNITPWRVDVFETPSSMASYSSPNTTAVKI